MCALTFILRNETYCVTGSIKLQVYEATSVDMKKLSYPIRAMVGEQNVPLRCSIEDFKKPDSVIRWYKVRETSSCTGCLERFCSINTSSSQVHCIHVSSQGALQCVKSFELQKG